MAVRVLLCDDRRSQVHEWASEIQQAVDDSSVVAMELEAFRDAVADLERRRSVAYAGEEWDDDHPFDEVDVLVLDYDLTLLEEGRFITGEAIAYLARCFSSCGLIVGLNQFKAGFDLSLMGHPESYADVNVRSEQLANPGLWSSTRSGFRPWDWPQLLEETAAFRQRCSAVQEHLDQPILDHLGLDTIEASLPRAVLEFLEGGDPPAETTFRSFVQDSDHGSRLPAPLTDVMTARVAAARIAGWLNQTLLPMQDVIIDAPHLVTRVPGLMSDATPGDWHSLTILYEEPAAQALQGMSSARYGADTWTHRACWYWAAASEAAAGSAIASVDDRVFCEDMSAFLPKEIARPFVAELPTAYRRRFVFDSQSTRGREYADRAGWSYSPTDVDYRPSVRFAM